MIQFALEVGIVHSFLVLFYLLILRREKHHQLQRFYLLLTAGLALVVPLIEIPFPVNSTPSDTVFSNQMNNWSTYIATDHSLSHGAVNLLNIVYTIVSLMFLLFMVSSLFQLFNLYTKSKREKSNDGTIIVFSNNHHSFSFFNMIFTCTLDPSIIAHEKGHHNYRHSIDILLLQTFRALTWWSPLSWWVLREIKLIHEYQADAFALKHVNFDEYRKALIESSINSMLWSVTSSFYEGHIKKRLHIMKTENKPIKKMKIVVLGTFIILLFSYMTFVPISNQDISTFKVFNPSGEELEDGRTIPTNTPYLTIETELELKPLGVEATLIVDQRGVGTIRSDIPKIVLGLLATNASTGNQLQLKLIPKDGSPPSIKIYEYK